MPKYKIEMTQTVYEGTTVEVRADNVADAQAIALTMAGEGDVEWKFLDTATDVQITATQEVS